MRPWRANDPNKARRVRESCAETMRYTQHGERVGREGGIAATKQARSANALYRLGWSKERQAKVSAHRHSFLLATTAASLPLSVPPFFILRALSLVVFPLSPRHPPSSRASAPFRSLRSSLLPLAPSSSMAEYDYLFKLLLIGDSGVGKSCLLLRFAVRVVAAPRALVRPSASATRTGLRRAYR